MDAQTNQAWVHESEIKLTPIEFKLFRLMLSRPNRVFTRADLIEQVLGYDYDRYDRSIDSHIKNFRKKITSVGGADVICAVYGEGYKLAP